MLISLTLENWMSFRDKTEFSMVASEERRHSERVPVLGEYEMGALPVTAIYGGNASGKSNFCEALRFAKSLVVEGSQINAPIPVEPFLLDTKKMKEPSRFCFRLSAKGTIYEFSFAVSREMVLEEKLVEITSAGEKFLYKRSDKEITFHRSLGNGQRLNFISEGTRPNQLFLTNSVSQNIEDFKPVFDWFDKKLEVISPKGIFVHFDQFFDQKEPLYLPMSNMLRLLDTGIFKLGSKIIPHKNIVMEEPLRKYLDKNIKSGIASPSIPSDNERLIISREDNELVTKKLVAYHLNSDGKEVEFELRYESDGTMRLIDLLPAFIIAMSHEPVYIIDEINQSLHTLLIRKLIETYLSLCSKDKRSQLIFTTHDVLLMDQDLLRCDEMWVTERDGSGATSLIALSEYKDIQKDKDIRKSYLQGRLGGIPNVLLEGALVESLLPGKDPSADLPKSKKSDEGSGR